MSAKSRWPSSRRSKFGSRKTRVGDLVFDSQLEAKVWMQLKAREQAGEIAHLQRQVLHRLRVNGDLICKLVADFEYDEVRRVEGAEIYSPVTADAKSAHTRKLQVFRLKAKLFKALCGREIVELGVER